MKKMTRLEFLTVMLSLKTLLEDAMAGKINLIIVKDLSRFGRNYIQVGQYIGYIFPTYNIRFIALNDNVDTFNTDSTAMDMMLTMSAATCGCSVLH